MAGFGGWLRRLFGDSEKECPTASVLPGRVRSEGYKSFAEANNEFALAMYGQLRARLGKVFFSPFSIRTALAMAQAGARGKTAHRWLGCSESLCRIGGCLLPLGRCSNS